MTSSPQGGAALGGAAPGGAAPGGAAHGMAVSAALGLAALPAAANGFGRFAYALVLPSMRASLDWSALAAGSLNAANALGYLGGAVAADRVTVRLGERAAILGSAIVSALAILGCATTGSIYGLLALRLLAGAAGAVAFIAGGALVARLAAGSSPRRTGQLLGVYFSGPGLGIAISALAITPLASVRTWRWCWLLLGGLCLVCVLIVKIVLRDLDTLGPGAPHQGRRAWDKKPIAALLTAYGFFGAGYIAYMTFVVAYLEHAGRTSAQLAGFWLTLGVVGVLVAATLFPRLQRIRSGRGVALLTGVVSLASLLPLTSSRLVVALVSAALFSAFLSITAAATACARHHLPASQWAPAIAGLTMVFGLGQCFGPILSGALSDGPSGLRAGLLLGSGLLAVSSIVALAQPAARTAARA